jgi:hypothetical protein
VRVDSWIRAFESTLDSIASISLSCGSLNGLHNVTVAGLHL